MQSKELDALRQRLLTKGTEKLSDAELLSVVLGSCGLARSLIHTSSKWQDLGQHDLSNVPRFSSARVAQVLGLVELARRITTTPLVQGQSFRCSDQVASAYVPRLASQQQEIFIVLALDSRHRVIAEHEIAKGTMASVQVDPRLVFRQLLKDGAASTVVIHNHPSGEASPSVDDMNMCSKLADAAQLLGIKLLDFVIVGNGSAVSFADRGLMPPEVKR